MKQVDRVRGRAPEGNHRAGFTLIELMVVVAIIATISSIAIPKLMTSRISANENAAIATLRTIAEAQAQFQSQCVVDTDADGGGEYGFFGELSGVAPLRAYDPVTNAGALGVDRLDPAILPTPFNAVFPDANGEGVSQRTGYYFKIFLPGTPAGATIPGVAELGLLNTGGGNPASLPASADAEVLWCCYAWPVDAGRSGRRVFFVNQEGEPLQFANQTASYSGIANPAQIPVFDAAYSNSTGGGDMGAPLGLTPQITANGFAANDGNTWTKVGN